MKIWVSNPTSNKKWYKLQCYYTKHYKYLP
jgi:hypothetical protein